MTNPKMEMVAVNELHLDPVNARSHDARNLATIKASLARFGQQKPIVVNSDGVVIAGNGTLQAAIDLGWNELNVIRSSLDGVDATAYAIADNRTAELATWDTTTLVDALEELQQNTDFALGDLGFSQVELDELCVSLENDHNWEEEWNGMPEFDVRDKTAWKTLSVHFKDQDCLDDFQKQLGIEKPITNRYLWWPEQDIQGVTGMTYENDGSEIDSSEDVVGIVKDNLEFTVYIPSKGRSTTCKTPALLQKNGIKFCMVVEPQDLDDYIQQFREDRVLVMDENDRGIAYARNWIKQYSISQGEQYHWQIDDDIRRFLERVNDKNIKVDALVVLAKAEARIGPFTNIGQVGLKHSMFAWSAKNEIDYNKQVCSCALINNEVDAHYREGLIEDTDYSMQVLTKGYCTITLNRAIYDPPPAASNEGGNSSSGHYDGYLKLLHGLQEAWPNTFQIVEKKGQPRMKPKHTCWTQFKQVPIR